MLPRMKEINHPITATDISDFEQFTGTTFPQDYKDFLLATNGGRPFSTAFSIADGSESAVREFLGFDLPVPTSELADAYETYGGALPNGVIPIANDSFGNYICLDMRGGRERVAFWDKSHFWSTGVWREKDLMDVASSFRAFLKLLDS